MRQPLILGNWKMHGSLEENRELLLELVDSDVRDLAVGVCPPAIYISQTVALLAGSSVAVGSQDVSSHSQGAFTGEIAASMLLELGCRYALVGHSERRQYHGETDTLIAEKFQAAQSAGLKPVLCVGETLEEREKGATLTVIAAQLDAVMSKAGVQAFTNAVVAYEPVWAIGTGKTASPEQAQEVHEFIRTQFGVHGEQLQIVYGGSVKAGNAQVLFAQPDIDGALVGGASLVAEDFIAICQAAKIAE